MSADTESRARRDKEPIPCNRVTSGSFSYDLAPFVEVMVLNNVLNNAFCDQGTL